MTEVHYFTACTVDGYIADAANSLGWLFEVPHDTDDAYWEEWFPDIGALVMGATTYEWMIEHEGIDQAPERWHQYYGERPGWVFTHRDLPRLPGVDITFAQGDVRPVYERIAPRVPEANIWVVGGALVGQFYDAGLLDKIVLGMAPVTLGAGAPLLPRRITSRNLAFSSAQLIGQRVRIVLVVRHDT
jgi:dihydrofolate reductase